jgi:hypothetical protein
MRTRPNDRYMLDFRSRLVQRGYSGLQRIIPSAVAGPYHLTVSDENKFMWFRVAKVGTRTIARHFGNHRVEISAKEPSFVRYSPPLYRDYFKFAFVRNPWNRLVSCWYNKILDSNYFGLEEKNLDELKSFENFVTWVEREGMQHRDRHTQLQVELINMGDLDFLGRMENFSPDFAAVCERIGIEPDHVRPANVSAERMSYREYYTPKLRDRVGEIYAADVQAFNYDF